ncbi:MAG: adenylate/guanylate cyclase domain-containing protein [Candidatus Vogelbacteria bacterium]|nr:adenylate/guanylate cyclase domain-containing protein [Candidatus Vogelbacteria bacterium]
MATQNPSDELVVSNRNTTLIINFCVKKGLNKSDLLGHLGYPEEYLQNPDHWVPLPVFHEITKRARKASGDDPSLFYDIGLTATAGGGLGAIEVMKRVMGAFIVDPVYLMQKVPQYNSYFNKTKNIEIVELKKDSAIFKIKFRPGIDPVYDFNSGPLVKGVIASIPHVWKMATAEVEETLLEYDVLRLLKEHFGIFAEIRDNLLYIEGQVYGRVMQLVKEVVKDGYCYLGKYKEAEEPGAPQGVLITKTLNYREYPLLIPGQIYNAPYFILRVKWKHASYFSRIRSIFSRQLKRTDTYMKEMEEKTLYFQKYARQLEDTVQERNKIILDEKEQVERLKNQLDAILSSHLPPELVHAMTTHKLLPKRNNGIVMFADLVGFSKRVHNTEDFAPLLRDLNRYFTMANQAIKSRNGWVYKYLGDAVMAVFGGYKQNEKYDELAMQAVESALKIVAQVGEMGWEVRVGIEYGDFIAGEIGPEEERIWDFLGETVNFACRLGQHADKNEILLGPKFVELIKDKINVTEKNVLLKGIGNQKVFSLENIA